MDDQRHSMLEHAKSACLIASRVMLGLFVASLAIGLVGFAIAVWNISQDASTVAYWTLWLVGFAMAACVLWLLHGFFHEIYVHLSPFGADQSHKLLLVGVLLVIRVIIDAIVPLGAPDSLALPGLSEVAVAQTSSGFDLNTVAFAAFFFCLAAVFKYGDALQKDSDSIV